MTLSLARSENISKLDHQGARVLKNYFSLKWPYSCSPDMRHRVHPLVYVFCITFISPIHAPHTVSNLIWFSCAESCGICASKRIDRTKWGEVTRWDERIQLRDRGFCHTLWCIMSCGFVRCCWCRWSLLDPLPAILLISIDRLRLTSMSHFRSLSPLGFGIWRIEGWEPHVSDTLEPAEQALTHLWPKSLTLLVLLRGFISSPNW